MGKIMQDDTIVFPPMDPEVFAAKLAKYNARGPRQKQMPKSSFGRVAIKRLPKESFEDWLGEDGERRKQAKIDALTPFPRNEI